MHSTLKALALAALLAAATSGVAMAQYAPSGDQTWAQPGQWQWRFSGSPPEAPWGYGYGSYNYAPYYGGNYAAPYGYYGYYGDRGY